MSASPVQFDRTWDIGEVGMNAGEAQIVNPNVTSRTVCQLTRHLLQGGLAGNLTYSVLPGVGIEILSDQLTEVSVLTYSLSERIS